MDNSKHNSKHTVEVKFLNHTAILKVKLVYKGGCDRCIFASQENCTDTITSMVKAGVGDCTDDGNSGYRLGGAV